ncbi:hypothetical protein OIU77_003506 [Salix suchowensis]|uniref:ATPase AAA-type core domain-containing protein n=1 Tax=Salix suchowensis TaxID=1278906 RepID=A0ABQ9B000_9ROSI|nr:hypothetical protein OIU77_003506 [Salix suchowensis]
MDPHDHHGSLISFSKSPPSKILAESVYHGGNSPSITSGHGKVLVTLVKSLQYCIIHMTVLSGLLNFIDGLWSSCGDERIIVFTTGHKENPDPALLRPGRMDMHIHMSYCTPREGFEWWPPITWASMAITGCSEKSRA